MRAPIDGFHETPMEQDHGPMDHAAPVMDSGRAFGGGPKLGMGPGSLLEGPFEHGPQSEGTQRPPVLAGLGAPSETLHRPPMSSGKYPRQHRLLLASMGKKGRHIVLGLRKLQSVWMKPATVS